MKIDIERLKQFEQHLNPQKPADSSVPAKILGYGEISSIFQIEGIEDIAFKRMPLFKSETSALIYENHYKEYCSNLGKAGLQLPEDTTAIINHFEKLTVLYIAQKQFSQRCLVHNLIHELNLEEYQSLLEKIVLEIKKVWKFNQVHKTEIELSLDGQLSNWVWFKNQLFFIDTSTPLFKKNGVEQLDPELLLQSAPGFLRWILRLFFLDDVMNRYYDQRQVYIDLVANLYKEQKPDLIPVTIKIINKYLFNDVSPLTTEEVEKYYKEDKLIWALFLMFRRVDRWLTRKLFRKQYQFILPGKIKR